MSIAAAATRMAATLAPRLSFAVASGIGRGLGSIAWAVDARHRDVAMDNLQRAFPGLSESARRRLALAAFRQAGSTALELLWSPALDDSTLAEIATFEGWHHLEEARAQGKGILMTAAHFGNWEIMGLALAHLGMPMNVIARRIDDEGVEDVLTRLRSGTGARVIHKEDAVRAALKALRADEIVGILIDQNTLASQGTFVPFFGRPASTTKITAQLHLRTGAPVLLLFCTPVGEGRYRIVIEPLDGNAPATEDVVGDGPGANDADDAPLDNDAAVERITAAATAQIERHIRACPEAWLWIHERWRAQPADDDGAAATAATPTTPADDGA